MGRLTLYIKPSPIRKRTATSSLNKPVLAVGLITMRYAPDKARESFGPKSLKKKDDGIERYARKTIRSWLVAASVQVFDRAKRVYGTEISRAVALAWNAWCDNRTLRYTIVRVTTKPLELRYCGPFNGNQSPNYIPLTESPNAVKGALLRRIPHRFTRYL